MTSLIVHFALKRYLNRKVLLVCEAHMHSAIYLSVPKSKIMSFDWYRGIPVGTEE